MKRSDLATQIPDFISLAEVRIARDLLSLSLEKSFAVNTISGTQGYAMPDDAVSLIRVDRSDGTQLLEYDPSVQGLSTSGKPYYYFFERGQIRFWPTPDGSYPCSIIYRAKLPALATFGVNQVLTDYPNLYLWASLTEGFLYLFNEERAIQYEGRYKAAIRDANKANNFKRKTLLTTELPRGYRYDIRSM